MARSADYSYRDDPSVPAFADDRPLILFDGECVFCSGWVQFLLKRDKEKRYRFIVAQTPLGEALYRHYLPLGAVQGQLTVQPYGVQEFVVCDPFNNLLIFSEPTAEQDNDAHERE